MDSLVESNGRRVFESLAAVPTLALVQVAVSIQVVFLEMYPQLEPHVALLTAVRTLFSVTSNVHVVHPRLCFHLTP